MASAWIVHVKFKSYSLTPVSFSMFCAFTPQAAHQFFADANYPKAVTYYVKEKRLPIYEEDSQQMRLMEE